MNILTMVGTIAGVLALLVARWAYKFQVMQFISTTLLEKAKECNSYLQMDSISRLPREAKHISGILSAIITGQQLMDRNLENKKPLSIDRHLLIDCFYLQLHTTIRTAIKDKSFLNKVINPDQIPKDQLNHVYNFLAEASNKYD